MKRKTRILGRILGLTLAFVMVLGMMPMIEMTAFAAQCAHESFTNGKCDDCGEPAVYSVTVKDWEKCGAVLVSVNGRAVPTGEAGVAKHGEKVIISLENIISDYITVHVQNYEVGGQRYQVNEKTLSLTIPAEQVTGDIMIRAYAYIRVRIQMNGGSVAEECADEYEVYKGVATLIKNNYTNWYRSFKRDFVFPGHTLLDVYEGDTVRVSSLLDRDVDLSLKWKCSNLTHYYSLPATCKEVGVMEHWACPCGRIYRDAGGTQEVFDLTVSKDPDNHAQRMEYTDQGDLGHKAYYPCCQEEETAPVYDHNYEDGVCDKCYRACRHTDADITAEADGVTHKISCECGFELTQSHSYINGLCACGKTDRLTVTFITEDGADSYEKEFQYGEVITVPTNEIFEDTFRKSGYTLTGWQGYTQGMTMPRESLTFTAEYTPNQYTVTFDTNGGGAITPIMVTFGETYGKLPSSAVTGLSGGNKNWYLVDNHGNVTDTNIKNLTKVTVAADHTLFLKRGVLTPNVSIALTVPGGISDSYQYYIPGASQRVLTAKVQNMNTEILDYTYQWFKDGAPVSGATSDVLILDGNVSDSGNYKVEVTATLKDGIDILVTAASATGSKEQKVKILHAANTLSYDANGGEGGPQSAYTGGVSLKVSKEAPSREHYSFTGWNTKPDGSGESFEAEDAYTFGEDGGNGGCVVTLYAQWKGKECTVTYRAEGETVSTEKVEYGKDATLPPVPPKEGFLGKWDNDGKQITGDMTINAVYTQIPAKPADPNSPQTGDNSNGMLWIGLLLVSSIGIFGLALYDRKRNAVTER